MCIFYSFYSFRPTFVIVFYSASLLVYFLTPIFFTFLFCFASHLFLLHSCLLFFRCHCSPSLLPFVPPPPPFSPFIVRCVPPIQAFPSANLLNFRNFCITFFLSISSANNKLGYIKSNFSELFFSLFTETKVVEA